MVDQWRWRVFSGQIPPERYNTEWWALKRQYQGVAPPSPRGEQFFGHAFSAPSMMPPSTFDSANASMACSASRGSPDTA